jgi:hypothetical protein
MAVTAGPEANGTAEAETPPERVVQTSTEMLGS